jgi:hypothetical protein
MNGGWLGSQRAGREGQQCCQCDEWNERQIDEPIPHSDFPYLSISS